MNRNTNNIHESLPRSSKNQNRRFFKSAKNIQKRSSENFMEFEKNFIKGKNSPDDETSEIDDSNGIKEKEINNIKTTDIKIVKTQENSKLEGFKKGLTIGNTTKFLSVNMTQILAKKFVGLLKKNANLHTFIQPNTLRILQDRVFFEHSKLISRRENQKFFNVLYWLKQKFMLIVLNENSLNFLLKISKTGIIHPFERMKIFWDIFLFINTLLMFFYIPFTLSFPIVGDYDRDIFHNIEFGIYMFDMTINFNTAYVDNGVVVRDRSKMLRNYIKGVFLFDFLALFSLIAKNEDFYSDETGFKNNYFMFFQLLFFALFPSLRAKFNRIKEFFCLDTKVKGRHFYIFCNFFGFFFFYFFCNFFYFFGNLFIAIFL